VDKSTGQILKANDVKVQGTFHLDVEQSSKKPTSTGKITSAPQVCIIESNTEFAVMEIICSCGTKIRVRCEYGEKKIAN
jgi:hypothetical protein